jgi:hypothetical protein
MLIRGVFAVIVLMLISLSDNAQIQGCTDPHAINYNSTANNNDGTCIYGPTNYSPEIFIKQLDEKVSGTAGLIFFNNSLWTINEGGGQPEIYKIDTITGQVIQTFTIRNATNKDWEDLTQDSLYIYIGDFGNHAGNRKDLCIYKVPKNQIHGSKNKIVKAEIISFLYSDQKSYKFNPYHHNFDCEAMIYKDDSLFMFTKNWEDNATNVYALSVLPGTYELSTRIRYDVKGLITGAGISPDGSAVTLVGNIDFQSFIIILSDLKNHDFFSGNKRRIEFPGLLVAKTKGLVYIDNKNILVSSGKSSVPQCIYQVNTEIWTSSGQNGQFADVPDPFNVKIISPNNHDKVSMMISEIPDSNMKIELYNSDWVRLFEHDTVFIAHQQAFLYYLVVKNYIHGTYFIKLTSGDSFMIKKLLIE